MRKNIIKEYVEYTIYVVIITVFTITALYSSINVIKEEERIKTSIIKSNGYSLIELQRSFNEFYSSLNKVINNDSDGISEIKDRLMFLKAIYSSTLHTNQHLSSGSEQPSLYNNLISIGNNIDNISKTIQSDRQILSKSDRDILLYNTNIISHIIPELILYEITPDENNYKEDHISIIHKNIIISVITMGVSGLLIILLLLNKRNNIKIAMVKNKDLTKDLQSKLDAINVSSDGIIIIDEHNKIKFMNNTLQKMHMIANEDIQNYIGHDYSKLYPETSIVINDKLKDHKKWDMEHFITLSDKIFAIEISAVKIKDSGFVIVVRNIEDRKKHEIEKEDLQKQFFQAQKMEAIGRLAGGIAHDFNNILASIMGNAEFLEEDLENDSKEITYAKKIIQGSEQAKKLIDQILAFSRRNEINKCNFNVGDAVKETISMLQATLPTNINMELDVGYNKGIIYGNENQVMQALMNICVNAKDSMENNNGTLKIRISESNNQYLSDMFEDISEELPNPKIEPPTLIRSLTDKHHIITIGSISKSYRYVCISISDTGTGINKKAIEHLFEPFYTTKEKGKGTGLGLSTVHGVISLNQGAMIIDTIIDKGTKFEIFIPIIKDIESSLEKDTGEYKIIIDENIINNTKILIVDDQDDVRETIKKIIQRIGYDVKSTSSPLEALDMIRENPDYFDLIISDYMMPDMTGMDFAQEIYHDLPDIPFIILTGYKKSKLEEAAKSLPSIKSILNKPINSRTINNEIFKIISSKTRDNSENIIDFPLQKDGSNTK